MTDAAISVERLGKMYRLSHRAARPDSFRELITGALAAPFRRLAGGSGEIASEDFWALRDISFEVKRGQAVGLVGRNGAGKSTLIKILSRIVEPTEGRAVLRGRLASLLEVGTGFHPDLTGRENVYLNGSILGMKKVEINRKFDEIVAFAEIEKFLDTPVKRYSSGMYVRLAFSVAAHLEPEILVVDEVLAVGDAEFQRKCLGKMREVSRAGGRTVLFVSHNMPAVSALCDRGVLLDRGRVVCTGPVEDVLSKYRQMSERDGEDVRVATPDLKWLGLRNRPELDGLRCDQDIELELAFRTGPRPVTGLHVDCALVDERDRMAAHCRSKFAGPPLNLPADTEVGVRFTLRAPRLAPGPYRLVVYAATGSTELAWIEGIDACTISAASPFTDGAVIDGVRGAVIPDFSMHAEVVTTRSVTVA